MASKAARDGWGPWGLMPGSTDLMAARHGYTIDLRGVTDSAQVLDWLCQIAGKRWADDACLAGFVRAVNALLRPQATLCPFGQSYELTPDEITERIARWVALADCDGGD